MFRICFPNSFSNVSDFSGPDFNGLIGGWDGKSDMTYNCPGSFWKSFEGGPSSDFCGSVSKTESEIISPTLSSPDFYDTFGWDLDTVWDLGSSSEYPSLRFYSE